MKKRIIKYSVGLSIILMFFVCFECIGYAQKEEKVRLAVLDFTLTGQAIEDFPDLHKIVQEWLTSFLVESSAFEIVERQDLEKVLQEQSLGQTGLLNNETTAQVGEILGVNILITGKLISFEDTLEVNVRLLDAANGSIIGVANVSTEDSDELKSKIEELAEIIRGKLSVPRTPGEVKLHERFDDDKLREDRWEAGYDADFKKSDKKKTILNVQDGVLRITGKYRKREENRIFWIHPNSAEGYHSFEAKIRIRELTGAVSICIGATWKNGDDNDEEESWTAICPYWEEDGGDISIGINEDSSDFEYDIQTNQWYTVRIDYIDMQFLYHWNGQLMKRFTLDSFAEDLGLNLVFAVEETRSVVIEVEEIILR